MHLLTIHSQYISVHFAKAEKNLSVHLHGVHLFHRHLKLAKGKEKVREKEKRSTQKSLSLMTSISKLQEEKILNLKPVRIHQTAQIYLK